MNSKHISVCHIISGDLWAGAEVMAFHLLNALKTFNDVELFAILLNEGRLATEIRKSGVEVYVVDEKTNSFLQILSKIHKIVKNRSVTVIHTHRYKENILALLLSVAKRKVRLVATQHGMPEYIDKKVSLHNLINKLNFILLARFFHKVVVVSAEMKKTLEQNHGFQKHPVSVIHNGIPISDKTKTRTERPCFVIGSSGRLFPVKDFALFVEMANILKSKPDIRFRLAGDGPENEQLALLIKKHNLGSVFEMMGHIEDTDSFYNSLDLYINTSKHEGIPMTILEAMNHGIPIVAPRIGGIPEIVDNGCEGFLVEERTPVSFAEKCEVLAKDKSLYLQMAENAHLRIVKDLSSVKMAERYRSEYINNK